MKMNRLQVAAICYYIAAVCWFIVALVGFVAHHEVRVPYLAMGSCCLCLGTIMTNKANAKKDDE